MIGTQEGDVELKSGILAEPVFVGRDRELEELQLSLCSAIEGKGTTVFVSGEAGTGKTRLINEFLTLAKKKEIIVLAGWCLVNAAVPYFPFAEAFDVYFSADNREENKSACVLRPGTRVGSEETKQTESEELDVRAWLMGSKQPEKAAQKETQNPRVWKDLTFAAVTKTLLSISNKRPTILFIDDIHWADSASLSLLHYVSRATTSARVLVLATFRSEELNADAEGHTHPLVEALRLMRREDLFKEIKLQNLSRVDVGRIAQDMLGGNLHPGLIEKLSKESQGNALFVVESLRMLSENGSLVQEHDQWRFSVDELGIPTKVRDIILQRLSALKSNQRRILDAASVIGVQFDPELLGPVLGQDSFEVLETLDDIAQSTSLVCCDENFYRFENVEYREVLYEEVSPPLRRLLHKRIAEKIESTSQNNKELPVSILAYHYANTENKEKSVKYALAAGEDALSRFSVTEAVRYFSQVIDATSGFSEYKNERIRALEGLGDAFWGKGLLEEAKKAFERLRDAAESGTVRLRALRKAMFVSFWRGDLTHTLELADEASEYAQLDRLEYARVRLYKGIASVSRGNTKQALDDMEESLRVFEEEYSLPDVAIALVEMATYYVEEGQERARLAAAIRSVALIEELEDSPMQMYAYVHSGVVFSQHGLHQEALDNYAKAIIIGEKIGDYNKMAWASYWSSALLESISDFRAAVSQSLKGAEYAEKTDAYYLQFLNYGNLTRQYAVLGELEHAEEFYTKLLKLFDEVTREGDWVLLAGGVCCKAVFYAAKGQWEEANGYFEQSLELYKKPASSSAFEAFTRKYYAWALEKQGRTEDARKQMEGTEEIIGEHEARFDHADMQANLMAPREVRIGEEFNIRLDIVNVAKNSGVLVRVELLVPPDFKVTSLPPCFNLQNGGIEMKRKGLDPFQVEPVKLSLYATKAGVFNLNPQVVYIDDLGETKTCTPQPIKVTVYPAHPKAGPESAQGNVLPGRITTGFADLDVLFLGGIPENYAVALTSPSSDEKELLITRFLEAGAKADETTFYITVEAESAKTLAEEFQSNFYLFICNPRADAIARDLPNVFKLKGVENLTDIDIALTRSLRMLGPSHVGPKRVCIEIISDVLLQHHAVIARKWLSGLLPDLKSKGFTTLAVIDPQMHPSEEVEAILGLFEGEIRILEKETAKGIEKVLKIQKLYNQKYLENELTLNREKLER